MISSIDILHIYIDLSFDMTSSIDILHIYINLSSCENAYICKTMWTVIERELS